jgi:FKBP-type peptidyl-prolyl cis-trans isomerase FkpA
MKTLKYLILLVCLASCIASCKKDNFVDNFDYEAQFKLDTTAIRSFVVANNIPVVKINDYGVFYQVLAPGTGSTAYAPTTQITVNYNGKLLNGAGFDSTAVGKPVRFPLGNMIAGWQIGLPVIQKGGKIRLFIPSYYGYGKEGKGPIPPNTALDFTIELVDVTN